jgi:hypothetical protein
MADPSQASAEFLRSYNLRQGQDDSSDSHTQRVTKYTETLQKGGSVEIHDTPGLLDTAGRVRDIQHIEGIDKHLKSLDYVDAVLFFFNGAEQDRANDEMKYVLALLSAVLPPAAHSNIVLLFSFSEYDPDSEPMMIVPYLVEEFGFTSAEIESRSFFVDNPLHAMAAVFNPDQRQGEQTIASLFRVESSLLGQYECAIKELNRLLRYITSGRHVVRCTNPIFGAMALKKGIGESLARFLGTVPTPGSDLDSNDFRPAAASTSLRRAIVERQRDVGYNLQSMLRSFNDGSRAAEMGKVLAKFHFASALCTVIYDSVFLPGPNDQVIMKEFRHMREQFQLINGKLNSLVERIKDVLQAELKTFIIGQLNDKLDAINDLADKLVIACHKGTDSEVRINRLLRSCQAFDSTAFLNTIRRYHIDGSAQWNLLRSAKYDPRALDDVHLSLGLILGKLLRADDICSTILELSESGGDWRSHLLNQIADGKACRDEGHDDMIADALSIFEEFPVGIRSKLLEGALSRRLPEDMRSVLQNHGSTDDAREALYSVVSNKYHPLFCETDNLEFFVAVYEECKTGVPRPSEQFLHTNPEETFAGSPCAAKVENVNGKCAVVMWNTCAPMVSADEFFSLFSCDYVHHGWVPNDCTESDAPLPSSGESLDDSLRSSASKLSGKRYSSWQLVRFGNGWRGRSTDPRRFVCKSPIGLYSGEPHPLFFGLWGPLLGDEEFHLVIA